MWHKQMCSNTLEKHYFTAYCAAWYQCSSSLERWDARKSKRKKCEREREREKRRGGSMRAGEPLSVHYILSIWLTFGDSSLWAPAACSYCFLTNRNPAHKGTHTHIRKWERAPAHTHTHPPTHRGPNGQCSIK